MKRTTNVESRLAEAQMHALAAVRREIRSRDSADRSKYLREFTQSFRKYDRVLSSEEFDKRVGGASILLVGDYHALPASQHFAANLLERVAQGSPVVLGVEAALSRDQEVLDSWWRREIGEDELRQRLRFDREWGYDWQPFYEFLIAAREHGEAVYGLDCMPRDDLRSICSRDRHAAAAICEMRQRHPQAKVVVLFGESHMAPQHLPAILRELLPQEQTLTILQNLDTLFWRAIGEKAAAVSIADDTVCVFNSSPLEKYESYRLSLERWNAAVDEPPDFAPAVYNLIFALARCLGFRLDSPNNGTQPKFLADSLPEVVAVEQDAEEVFAATKLASEFAGSGPLSQHLDQVRSELVNRLEGQGCVYVPAANRFLIREFRMNHVAAEAARFLHHACGGSTSQNCSEAKLENALAHFGSRLLCPGTVTDVNDSLGDPLYRAYLEGRVTKASIRRMFLRRREDLDNVKATLAGIVE
jgi:uncharacterized iron-regulated protein